MKYLKKFYIGDDKKGGTRNLEEARKLIAEGKELHLLFSEDKLASRGVKDPVAEIIEEGEKIIIKTREGFEYHMEGFDDNAREIGFCYFIDIAGKIYSISEAREMVKNGVKLRARTHEITTSTIAAFLEDDLFETISGSLYRIIS